MSYSRFGVAAIRPWYRPTASALLSLSLLTILGGCAAVPLEIANSLKSYDGLTSNHGRSTKADFKVSSDDLGAIATIYIEPTMVSGAAAQSIEKSSDRALVANVISRAICVGVSDRFEVVSRKEDADLIVHATITQIVPTNATMAGLSTATSLGASVFSPVPVPRLPLGLGGLSVEAEATTREGKQVGAMVWAKGANFVTTGGRVSQIGDAYSLAASFGGDFSKMLVSGKTPFKGMPKIPSGQRIKSGLGGKARFPACENFGRSPGLIGLAASQVGMPPSWTDKQRLAADQ
ncbi:DUF3313 domain-containing protein [Pseudorhizobium marinum]|uniref:DUF3313 domain-containing protein n=1 Tax=Pseudorhizobium marinum TaxID=1496690 RepID=UPI00049710C8|nr:DUF3313 domain-containing protein [Pseudorhizobium marinum]MDY6947580.1 DUF3313 domain-containing protein [Pseudomonadota bacterium]